MKLATFLFEGADALHRGDFLRPDVLLPLLDDARCELDQWAKSVEETPMLDGLEALEDSTCEAIDCFYEALDLLELAVLEEVPELSDRIKELTQDGIEFLRDLRDRAESQATMLTEEMAFRA